MRILLLNERDPEHPDAGGAETHVHEVFRRLAARGHSVTELVSSFPQAEPRAEREGIRFERLGKLPLYYPRAALACARRSRSGEFDVVVECLNKMPFLAPLYAARPVLGLCHHLFGSTAFVQVAWPVAAAVWCAERAIPATYRHSWIVAISESTRVDLVERGLDPRRIDVQPPGIRLPELVPYAITQREALIVYVGRLETYKRIDILLDAVARLATEQPDLHLAIVGRGAARSRLERRAAKLGIAERVSFPGFVSDAERDVWLARARVCVCPSVKEGFGLTVIEANALGTPNVASDAPGLRDAVRDGETGFLVPEGDAAALAARIAALLTDDELADRMSQAALAWSRSFDWERAADGMERSLSHLVQNG
jgi:glycosyltransferase involved in cell wall biosynthesis